MKNCQQIQEFLSAYVDKELPIAEIKEVEQHILKCKKCFGEYLEQKFLNVILKQYKKYRNIL